MNWTSVLLCCLAGLAGGCNSRQAPPPEPAPSAESTTTPAVPLEVPALPSQDEADAAARAAIGKENADQEFERLEKELGGG